MRSIITTNLNCIRSDFGFGRQIDGGMGDVARSGDALATRLYRAPATCQSTIGKHVAVEPVSVQKVSVRGCSSQPCVLASCSRDPLIGHRLAGAVHAAAAARSPQHRWRQQGPTVSPASRRIG